jgi:4-oxalocrotonate tautomerase
MPSRGVQIRAGVFSPEDKAQPIPPVTDALGSVAGETMRQGTPVRIHATKSGDRGHAGPPHHAEDRLAMWRKG